MSEKLSLKPEIDSLIKLFKEGKFDKTLVKCDELIKKFSEEPFLYNLKGMVEIKLNNFNHSIISFKQAIKLNPGYVEAYNNLSTTYINLGEFERAVSILKKSIVLKPNYANAFNNLASALNDQGNYGEALKVFDKLYNLDPNYPGVKENIIKLLTYYKPSDTNLNIFTKLNNLLININFDKEISDVNIVNIYNRCKDIVSSQLDGLEFNFSQIWRRNNIDLNCTRHFDVFRNFNVIPEYCFGCFKVQIELSSLVDLFRLYILFDRLKLDQNKSRKCIVEMREISGGTYKGLIYCTGLEEGKNIYSTIKNITEKAFTKNFKIKLRRGCTEFGKSYPDYKDINRPENNLMKYNSDWKEKEDIIDNKLPKKNRINSRKLNKNISGLTLNDFLIMKNWIMYAKIIKDDDYKKFDTNIKISEYMIKEMSNQVLYRNEQLKKTT